MAYVELKAIYIHDASDLSDYIVLEFFGTHGFEVDTDDEVRTRGQGREQAVRSLRQAQTIQVDVPVASQAQWRWLRDHQKTTVMYRDPRGELAYGIYSRLGVSHRHVGDSGVSLQIRCITRTEVTPA